jgi:hypothetical protein
MFFPETITLAACSRLNACGDEGVSAKAMAAARR